MDYVGLFGYVDDVGRVLDITIEDADVNSVQGSYVGCVAGYNLGRISNCHVSGKVSAGSYVGGMIGRNQGGAVLMCSADVNVVGEIYQIGGLIGRSESGGVYNCYATGSVQGSDAVGGLIGDHRYGDVNNCFADTSVVTLSSSAGGFWVKIIRGWS
ncbi:MAG: hypothetical protein JXB29_03755 [Sedimentisphaerales bacterium]|nr:hypothetical protein [Sedimentisphaerales bacterium]